ncbi:hypothetical protein [Treponema sp. R6D11]
MTFFCLLWVPLFYLFRRSISGSGNATGSVWALILGSITAIIQYLLGYIFNPGGFGFSRWLFGFFEIVSMPVILPFIAYFIMYIFSGFSDVDFSNFTLLWLIPVGALRALTWSSMNDPILLVMAPLLWTALAVGISYLIIWMTNSYNPFISVLAILCMILLPITGAAAYWAFFSQQTILGFLFLIVAHVPFGLSFVNKS